MDPQVSVVLIGAAAAGTVTTPRDLRQDLPLDDLEVVLADDASGASLPRARGLVVLLLDRQLVPAADLARQALSTVAALADRDRDVLLGRVLPPAFGSWDAISDALARRGSWADITDGTIREPRRLAARCFCLSRSAYERLRAGVDADHDASITADVVLGFRLWNDNFRLRFQPRLRAHHPRLLSVTEAASQARREGAMALRLAERNPEFRRKLSLPSHEALASADVTSLGRRLSDLIVAAEELSKIDLRKFAASEKHELGVLPALGRVADLVVAEVLDAASWLGWVDHGSASAESRPVDRAIQNDEIADRAIARDATTEDAITPDVAPLPAPAPAESHEEPDPIEVTAPTPRPADPWTWNEPDTDAWQTPPSAAATDSDVSSGSIELDALDDDTSSDEPSFVAPVSSAKPIPAWMEDESEAAPPDSGSSTLVMEPIPRDLIDAARVTAPPPDDPPHSAESEGPTTLVMESPWKTGEIPQSLLEQARAGHAVQAVHAAEPSAEPSIASIIIVARNAVDTIGLCLDALAASTSEKHDVFIVDNASTDGTAAAAKRPGVRVITIDETEGYARAANRAMRDARGSNLVFLAPDAIVTDGWLTALIDAAELGVGAVGPVSNGLLGSQQVTRWVTDPAALGHPITLLRALQADAPLGVPVRYLQPHCVLVPRAELAAWGHFEPRLHTPQAVFMHLAWQLSQGGKALRVAPRSFVSRPSGLRLAVGSAAGLSEPASFEYERRFRRDMELLRTQIAAAEPQRSLTSQEIWGVSWTGFDDPALPSPGNPTISVVIPVCNQLEYTRQCLQSLARRSTGDIEIIVFDNGSTDGTREFLMGQPAVRVLSSPRNLGFAPAVNRGIAASTGRNVLLLNNDVVVPVDFLDHMLATAEAHPECGILGPVSNNCAAVQQVPADYANIAGLEQLAVSRWDSMGNRVRYESVILGFAMFIRREVIDSIGGFDEQFEVGNFEDNDYSLRSALMGWKLGVADGVFIHHYGSRTFAGEGLDYPALMRANHERFLTKWHGPSVSEPEPPSTGSESWTGPERSASVEVGGPAPVSDVPGWIPVEASTPDPGTKPVQEENAMITSGDAASFSPKAGDIYLVANARFEEGKYEEAVDLFTWSIEGNPEIVLAHMGLGLALARLGRLEEAVGPLERCVALDPTFSEGYNNLGVVYHLAGRTEKAREAIERAIALDPDNLEARANLNEVLYRSTSSTENATAA